MEERTHSAGMAKLKKPKAEGESGIGHHRGLQIWRVLILSRAKT